MDNKIKYIRTQSVSSVVENRMPLFWGLNRKSLKATGLYKAFEANDREIVVRKDNYVLRIKNDLLTQTHKDILEALLLMRNGKMVQSFNMYDIFKVLDKKTKNNYWLEDIIEELVNVKIHITYDNDNYVKMFGILTNLEYERENGEAVITWDDAFLSIYDESAVLNYSKYINSISNLKHDITKQVVRWLLSYPALQIDLKKLVVNKLGFGNIVKSRSIYNYIQNIKNEDLSMFGITISDDQKPIISIVRPNDIGFYNGAPIQDITSIKRKRKRPSNVLPLFELE